MVELPSKPHSGSCSSVGNESNSLICVLPRKFGVGVYPSSQIYSSLYFVIELSHELMMRKVGTEASNRSLLVTTRLPGPPRPVLTKQLRCQIAALRHPPASRRNTPPPPAGGRNLGVRQRRAGGGLDEGPMARFGPGLRLITQQSAAV